MVIVMESNRNVLEVLKFLEVQDILRSTACVSQQWLRLSNSSEVWHFLCESIDISPADITSCRNNPKLAYEELRDPKIFNLVTARSGKLKLFDCQTHKTLTDISCAINTASSAVMVRDDEVFITGSDSKGKEALLINFGTSQITKYPDLLDFRRYHGSARIHRIVYLFGGDLNNCKSAEKCSLPRKEWRWLPPMSLQRSAFTPCVRKWSIYLCGGNVDICHVFDTHTNTYEALPFQLPGRGWCIATLVEKDLIIENESNRCSWKPGENLRTFTVDRRIAP